MADVPDDILDQIKYLEKIFTVDQDKLKEVTNRFVKELDKGILLFSITTRRKSSYRLDRTQC